MPVINGFKFNVKFLFVSSVGTLDNGDSRAKLPCSAYKSGRVQARGDEICYEDSPTARAYSDEAIKPPPPPPPPPIPGIFFTKGR